MSLEITAQVIKFFFEKKKIKLLSKSLFGGKGGFFFECVEQGPFLGILFLD